MGTVAHISLVLALLTTGLMSGVYLAFSISVLPGLGRTDDVTFVAAMREMNRAILNPVFGIVFGGPLVLDVLAVATRLPDQTGIGWSVTALVLYVVTLAVTAVVNVPLNDRLDSTEPADAARTGFETRWVRWNVVRTLVCTASFAALAVALLS
ncbi:MAG: anthrone oxygenase family protein [Marmoricola sp.]